VGEKTYVRALREGARKRHYPKTDKGAVTGFMVQLEIAVNGVWRPVIRYDCAHDFSHIDRYNVDGKQEKEQLQFPYDEALTLADEDIDLNLETYKTRFLEGQFP
jgi:hypothetical protein